MHYHGTPITPVAVLMTLRGKNFCVSHARPDDVERVHSWGQSVMLDNGAWAAFRTATKTNWPAYYVWTDKWLHHNNTWAVIPDIIDGTVEQQDRLLKQWPHGDRGVPVWHLHEPISRLLRLTDKYPRICMGSSQQYLKVMSASWQRRMDEAWNALALRHQRVPWVHMLRGMQCCGKRWPFSSADSTDVAQNHHLKHNTALAMANRWDVVQCPVVWVPRPIFKPLWSVR